MKHLNGKRFGSAALTAALLVSLLSACGTPAETDPGTTPPQEGNETPSAEVTDSPVSEDAISIWAFAEPHARYFEWVTEEYKKEHPDLAFSIELMDNAALQDRLTVVITAGGDGTPDFVDVEQGAFSRYMSPDKMCFEPLNPYLDANGTLDKMVESRLSLYSYDGNYYGLEHALCPTTMAYRPDLFEEHGIKVPTTWDEFKDAAAKFKEQDIYISAIGDLALAGPLDEIGMLLRSAGKDVVADDGSLYFGEELKGLLEDYRMMQNEEMMYAYETEEDRWVEFRDDKVATLFAPDWAAGWLRDNVPEQSGQWAMTYLPKLTSDSARTSCQGGTGLTMMSYTKKDKEVLWDFMEFSQVDAENNAKKYELINLYPPVYDAMELCNKPVEYYDNQNLGELYQELSKEMPKQNQSTWRNFYTESFKTYAFDYAEGSMTTDEILAAVEADINDYIADQK